MAQVKMQTARTTLQEPAAAAEDLLRQLGPAKPVLVTMFASRERDQYALNRAVRERLPRHAAGGRDDGGGAGQHRHPRGQRGDGRPLR